MSIYIHSYSTATETQAKSRFLIKRDGPSGISLFPLQLPSLPPLLLSTVTQVSHPAFPVQGFFPSPYPIHAADYPYTPQCLTFEAVSQGQDCCSLPLRQRGLICGVQHHRTLPA